MVVGFLRKAGPSWPQWGGLPAWGHDGGQVGSTVRDTSLVLGSPPPPHWLASGLSCLRTSLPARLLLPTHHDNPVNLPVQPDCESPALVRAGAEAADHGPATVPSFEPVKPFLLETSIDTYPRGSPSSLGAPLAASLVTSPQR